MQSFLGEVVEEIKTKYGSIEDLIFVLPSKRAGNFLRNLLANSAERTFFSPEIYSIERFIEQISDLSYATSIQQLFVLYQTYLKQKPVPQDNFHTFSKWGQTLLQDFNEIDRYLIDTGKLFDNLSAVQQLEHWSLQPEKTQMMQDYLNFWNNLESLYLDFNRALLEQGLGHQGLVYRTACEKLDSYLSNESDKNFVFLGFNALNTAESQIIQHILATTDSEIYWDIDTYFLDDPIHDAGYFFRQHLKTWPYLRENELRGKSAHYTSKKEIKVVGVPKSVSQAKYAAHLLEEIRTIGPEQLKNTAVVLGDETLLNPLLNSVPEGIDRVNITMGYPLDKTPLASFFDQFMTLYLQRADQGWFYRELLVFLAHPSVHTLLNSEGKEVVGTITETIERKNWAYVDVDKLDSIPGAISALLPLLFMAHTPDPKEFIQTVLKIIAELKINLQGSKDTLSLEYLYHFHGLFNQLDGLLGQYGFITDLQSLRSLYRQLVSSETLDFQGEPLEGLQIMGMLESRNLDFETVIITSVNEGILPSGKSNSSFIPFDLKRHFGLPTYKEKDAVYTYHFYRLLQRAKHVFILYSTEPDDALAGGERSRLIDQLLTDENRRADISEINASPAVAPTPKTLESIAKNEGLLELIKAHAAKGFSPTSLSNYIRNPLDFYKRNLLGIDDSEEVEESVAANTFGTIVHDTLEDLYRPFIGELLTAEGLLAGKGRVKALVKKHFAKSYADGDMSRGKNLIAFNVVGRYVERFLDKEIEEAKTHQIKIIGLEEKLEIELDIPDFDFPVRLKGKLDRIDEFDGVLRIIDYKTGKVENKNVEIVDWEEAASAAGKPTPAVGRPTYPELESTRSADGALQPANPLISEYDCSKAFQLLCYALMYHTKNPISTLEAGIFSFKNQSAGLMRFATKPKKGSRTKDHDITEKTLSYFSTELKRLILEIFDINMPFVEKEV
ncbi:MAG TPA: PD-(D/E)XK nuclease family protein [Pricia sp.]|nr:PD-(D/E)XK nuclease family protein [Pricia sp.]